MMVWFWCAVMLIALAIEVVTVGNLITVWFAVGGFFALLCALLNAHYLVQIIVFAVISIVCILLLNRIASNYFRGNITATNADRIVGQHIRLLEAIEENKWGIVSYNGSTWSAISYNNKPIAANTMVTVLAIEGAKVVVKAID